MTPVGLGVFTAELAARPATTTRLCWTAASHCPTRARAGSRRACAGPPGCGCRTQRRRRSRRPGSTTSSSTNCTSAPSAPRGRSRARSRIWRSWPALGVTAIEIMPVAEFPGARGWGYDGVYLSAAQSSYGGPSGLAELVSAAHATGLAVILDVVYNHVGASGVTALEAFGPYFTEKYETPWGRAINYDDADSDPVREWVLQSASGWVRDFGIDGSAPRRDPRDLRLEPGAHRRRRRPTRPRGAGRRLRDRRIGAQRPARHAPARRTAAGAATRHGRTTSITRCGRWSPTSTTATTRSSATLLTWRRRCIARTSTMARTRRFAAAGSARRRTTSHRSGSSCSRRTTIRSATVPSATGCRPRPAHSPRCSRCSRRLPRCCSWARNTASRPHFSSFPTTSTRRSPMRRGTAAARSSRRSRRSPRRSLIHRPSRRSRRPSSRAAMTLSSPACTPTCSGSRTELPDGDVDTIAFDEASRWLRFRRGDYEVVCNVAAEAATLSCEGETVLIATHESVHVGRGEITLPPLSGALVR